MNPSFISLLSILFGIIGANLCGRLWKKYSLGLRGNTIAGVFGSVLLIKSFGRLGFDPGSIVLSDSYLLLTTNLGVSLLGGFAIIPVYFLKRRWAK